MMMEYLVHNVRPLGVTDLTKLDQVVYQNILLEQERIW